VDKVIKVASKLGEPEEVMSNALKKEIVSKIIEFEGIMTNLEKKYGTTLE